MNASISCECTRIRSKLSYVGEVQSFTFERALQILEHLAHLSREIALAHGFAGVVDRELTGYEYHIGHARPRDVAIRPERLRQSGWITVFHRHIRHAAPSSVCPTRRPCDAPACVIHTPFIAPVRPRAQSAARRAAAV